MKIIKKYIYHPLKNLIARWYLFILRKFTNLMVIGITGSAGKTTTKEMIASVLKLDGKTVWSEANIDPVYNIASTILKTPFGTKYLVLELGVEYPNEMDFYLKMGSPDIGLITNIYPTHTLFFGDRAGVFKEKRKLHDFVKVSILNKDDEFLSKLKGNIYWFKSDENPFVSNQNAARAVCQALKIKNSLIDQGLKLYQNPVHRLSIINHKSGAVIFDDSYNSNPEAFIKSLNYFNKISKGNKKIAVIGDMLELGKLEIAEHKRIARYVQKSKFNKVFGVGNLVKYITSDVYKNVNEILPIVRPFLKPKTYIFVKGSRSIGLDKLISLL